MLEIAIIAVLILSIVLHEVAHGFAANALGDPTARLAGRLSPNPLLHIDPVGSVFVPAMLFLSHSPLMFGWAKPVPYNPYNLSNQKWGESLVAVAGPFANVLLAFIFSVLIRFTGALGLSPSFVDFASYIVFLNILLAIFNLLPVPPLDGSKVIAPFLPGILGIRYRQYVERAERNSFLFLFILLFTAMLFIGDEISFLAMKSSAFLTGLPFGYFAGPF